MESKSGANKSAKIKIAKALEYGKTDASRGSFYHIQRMQDKISAQNPNRIWKGMCTLGMSVEQYEESARILADARNFPQINTLDDNGRTFLDATCYGAEACYTDFSIFIRGGARMGKFMKDSLWMVFARHSSFDNEINYIMEIRFLIAIYECCADEIVIGGTETYRKIIEADTEYYGYWWDQLKKEGIVK